MEPEVAFEAGQALVGGDGAGGVEGVRGDGGADDVDPVGGASASMVAWSRRQDRRPSAMSRMKCLATLRLLITFPAFSADLVRVLEPPGRDLGGDLAQVGLGGGQQVLALAGALGGQDRVAAGDQPLAGVVRAGDLGQVLLVEQRQLQRAVVVP